MRRRPEALALLLAAALGVAQAEAPPDSGSCPIPQHHEGSGLEPKSADSSPGGADAADAATESKEAQHDRAAWEGDLDRPLPASRLNPADVAAIVAALGAPEPAAGRSWWDRLMAALDAWLVDQMRDVEAPDWLPEISARTAKIILLAFFALMVAGLLGIVIFELRQAGVLGRRRRAAATVAGLAPAAIVHESAPTLDEIARLPRLLQAPALLSRAVRALIARGRLPDDDSLTNGELTRTLDARQAEEAPVFRRLARIADAAAYGAVEPLQDELAALRSAVGLLEGPGPAA